MLNLIDKSRLLARVEEAMLRGFTNPAQLIKRVRGITDAKTAQNYIQAVQAIWQERSKSLNQLEEARARLIRKAELLESDFQSIGGKKSNKATRIQSKRAALECQKQQAALYGLDLKRFILSKEDNPLSDLTDEQLQREIRKTLSGEAQERE